MLRLLVVVLASLFFALAFAEEADSRGSVYGLWASEGSVFHVYEISGVLHADIVSIDEPFYSS